MAGTHGDLFREIGALVVAAHEGAAIDLKEKASELAARYDNLHVPESAIATAIARSASAVGISLAMVNYAKENGAHRLGVSAEPIRVTGASVEDPALPNGETSDEATTGGVTSPAVVLPSGVRLAVLS